MINQEDVWREFAALPPAAQQEVLDFIAFLQLRYGRLAPERDEAQPALRDEPFVGMWRDRDDMQDSTAWVREVRAREWN